MFSSVESILQPTIILSMVGAVSTLSLCGQKLPILLIIFQSFILVLNFVHFVFIPFGMTYLEKISQDGFNTSQKELSSQHFKIKVINPLLTSVVAIFYRCMVLFEISRKKSTLLSLLKKVDTALKIPQAEFKKNTLTLKVFALTTLIISWPFQISSFMRLPKTCFLIRFLVFFVNIYNNFSAACCELQFISLCYLILSRFRLLHQSLDESNNTKLRNLSAKILVLRDCHHDLCESITGLNRLYNRQLFISLASLFVNTLLNLYFAIFGGFTQPATRFILTQNSSNITNSVLWSIYYFVRFVSICVAADVLIDETRRTKVIILDIMRKPLNEATKGELWNFLVCTVVRKMKFSAAGFFRINFSLITTAIATGTTYLVILAQFHKE